MVKKNLGFKISRSGIKLQSILHEENIVFLVNGVQYTKHNKHNSNYCCFKSSAKFPELSHKIEAGVMGWQHQ